MKRNNWKGQTGFTLVELLAVIAIIGMLAGLVLYLGPTVNDMRKRKLVHAQMEQLTMLIENYKEVKGSYPPENLSNPATNALYYELTGTTTNANLIKSFFGVDAILNAIDRPKNFFPSIKDNQFININPDTSPTAPHINILGVKVTPPKTSLLKDFCPWHYRVAPQGNDPSIHNPQGFDIWVNVEMNKGPMTIGNWKDKE